MGCDSSKGLGILLTLESDILSHADWLIIAKMIPQKYAISAAAFMLQEGLRTGLYIKHGLCRVYIELWSQNNLPAMRIGDYRNYWCAMQDALFVDRTLYGRKEVRKASGNLCIEFSGAKTRACYEALVKRCVCLKDSLEKLYLRLPEIALT